MNSIGKSILISIATSLVLLAGCSPDKGTDASTNDEKIADVGIAPVVDPAKAAAGKAIFQQCIACHSILGDGVGPNLHGVYGRRAGSLNEFQGYSPAIRASHIVWDERQLSEFLANPAVKVKGTAMMFPGISNAKEREDVIEYLKSY